MYYYDGNSFNLYQNILNSNAKRKQSVLDIKRIYQEKLLLMSHDVSVKNEMTDSILIPNIKKEVLIRSNLVNDMNIFNETNKKSFRGVLGNNEVKEYKISISNKNFNHNSTKSSLIDSYFKNEKGSLSDNRKSMPLIEKIIEDNSFKTKREVETNSYKYYPSYQQNQKIIIKKKKNIFSKTIDEFRINNFHLGNEFKNIYNKKINEKIKKNREKMIIKSMSIRNNETQKDLSIINYIPKNYDFHIKKNNFTHIKIEDFEKKSYQDTIQTRKRDLLNRTSSDFIFKNKLDSSSKIEKIINYANLNPSHELLNHKKMKESETIIQPKINIRPLMLNTNRINIFSIPKIELNIKEKS